MKKSFSLCLAVSLIFSGVAMAAEYPKQTIRLSHNQPAGSPEDIGAQAFKAIVEEKSEGSVTVDVFPQMQMGSMREQAEMVQMGTLELTVQPVSVLTPFVDELKVIDFPFLWPSTSVLYSVMDGPVGQNIYNFADPKGFKVLGMWSSGFKQFTTKDKDVTAPEDFKGLKIRVMPSPLLLAQYKAWGANPIPIEYAELYNALQQKMVDGQENPIQTVALAKLYEVQDRLIISNHGFLAYLFTANAKWFNKLDDATRELLVAAEKEARQVERQAQAEKESQYLEQIRAAGTIKVTELTAEQREDFSAKTKPVHQEFASTPELKKLLEEVYQAIEEQK